MHPSMQPVVLRIDAGNPQQMEAAQEIIDAMHDSMEQNVRDVARELGIKEDDAALVCYLRTRSRWSQEKEDHLVELSKAGKELPNVLAGEF